MKKPGQLTAMVSSTALDLPEHRQAVIDACLRAGVFPIAMEHHPARDASGIRASLDMVDHADIYIGVYAWRYGWIPDFDNPERISITEMEFNRAVERKERGGLKEILVFLMHDDHPIKASDKEDGDEAQRKLKAFKERASAGRVHSEFTSKEDLCGKVLHSLDDIKSCFARACEPAAGDEAAPDPIPKPPAFYAEPRYIVTQSFVGRESQLEVLSKWAMPSEPHTILLFEAIGGNGKSMLTWQWTTELAATVRTDWAGRFWYSFYEKGAVMTDFCRRALAYITGCPLKAFQRIKTPELAEMLLHHLQDRPWLFVLDGLERVLVAYHRIDAAEVRDEDLNRPTDKIAHRDPCAAIRPEDDDLLRALASAAPSKLLVSSRLVPRALLNRANHPMPSVRSINLPGLLPPDAEKLLRSFEINGDSRAIQNYLETHCACHPLVIGVLAGLINDYLPDRGNFDAWAADRHGGNQLNLANLDLVQKRNHILTAGLNALSEKSRQLLSTLALLSEAVDYPTLCAFHPHLPPEPEEVEEPSRPQESWVWDSMSKREKAEARKEYESAVVRRKEYQQAVKARLESPELLAAAQELNQTVSDLVRRGLLQYDGRVKRYDLHPVVRGVAAGSLLPEKRDRYGMRVVDHFSRQAHNPYDEAETLEDLRCGLNVVRTLLKMGRYQEAYDAYKGDLSNALTFNLEADAESLSLLRPFFPKGWGAPPAVVDKSSASYLANDAGMALRHAGQPGEAMIAHSSAIGIDLALEGWPNVTIQLLNISVALSTANRLGKQGQCLRLGLELAELIERDDLLFSCRLSLFGYYGIIGDWAGAEAMWQRLNPMARPQRRGLYRLGKAEFRYCLVQFWKGDLREEDLAHTEQLTNESKTRELIRNLFSLRGEWLLERGLWAPAAESLHEAVRMARVIGKLEGGSEARLALARFHLGQLPDPRGEAQQLAQARESDHLALADLWLAIGDRKRAKKHALAAYKWAWGDGEPYVHRYELNKAVALLERLGVAIPQLPPYDPAKDERLPWEDDVVSAIEKLRAEKEAKKADASSLDAGPR